MMMKLTAPQSSAIISAMLAIKRWWKNDQAESEDLLAKEALDSVESVILLMNNGDVPPPPPS